MIFKKNKNIKGLFSKKLDDVLVLKNVTRVFHNKKLNYIVLQKKHKVIKEYLLHKYSNVIDRYVSKVEVGNIEISSDKNIWTFWWQGQENAPEIIQLCIESMRKYANGHQVIVITQHNYLEYLNLPEYILEKVKCGAISITHLSDIVRMNLLKEYGGLWLDATIFVNKPIEQELFLSLYYTGKQYPRACPCISEYRWTGSLLAGTKDNLFFSYMLDSFYEYWRNEEVLIDYFLIDYFVELAYEKIPGYTEQLNNVPINNTQMYELAGYLNSRFDEQIFSELNKDTSFFKLQHRSKYLKKKGDKLTYYGKLYEIVGMTDEIIKDGSKNANL